MADLQSVAVQISGAWLQENKKWPGAATWFYSTATFFSSPGAEPTGIEVPVVDGAGLVATDLVVTDAWMGCMHHRKPWTKHNTPSYLTVRATSGSILGEPFKRPDGVFIEIQACNPDLPLFTDGYTVNVIFDAPPEGTPWCGCGKERRKVVSAAICAARDAITSDAEAMAKVHAGRVYYIHVPRGADVATVTELSEDELDGFMQRPDVRGCANLIVRAPNPTPCLGSA